MKFNIIYRRYPISSFINKESLQAFTWLNKFLDKEDYTYSLGKPKYSMYQIIASIFIFSLSGFHKKLFHAISLYIAGYNHFEFII